MEQYHIQRFEANDIWPIGGWSVYRINGDEISQRIIHDRWKWLSRKRVRPDGKTVGNVRHAYGKVVERHSWCGYLGIVATLEGVVGLILADKAK